MTKEVRQLWLVESGEYSDFGYVLLSFPADFDMRRAAAAFKAIIPPDAKPYSLGAPSLSGFLCKEFGGRDPDPGETVSFAGKVMDPIHYGNWDPDDAFPWNEIDTEPFAVRES